ncbi:hypothetical protein GM921_00640 [Pedobacter sp. LMG 31464]|uniref:Uncharacterized protein n=1 Tax=Pedobacter planticolens TaxID=2679964 RepID=A0A923DXZ6_9SPHI|nr:hypothetical protein [Pedobacter planticolens]MBB2143977.1 hypothetical protein [Pedobacter planticolens]
MHTENIPEEIRENWKYAFQEIRKDRDRYLGWIKEEIEKVMDMINKHDKIYILGGLATKLIRATPTLHNQFLETYQGEDKGDIPKEEYLQPDDQVELLLEYAMSIATSSVNQNKGKIPTQQDIDAVYEQLAIIKQNMAIYEISAENVGDGSDADHWLRTQIVTESIHVRGSGYQIHIIEVFNELFAPHNDFIKKIHGFDASELLQVILKLDTLVFSKIGSAFGAGFSHQRMTEWMEQKGQDKIHEEMVATGKHFIRQFTEANPDLYSPDSPDHVIARSLDDISSYQIIYWVIPNTPSEKIIFEAISTDFGQNNIFLEPAKFKAFILNDTLIKYQPLVKENDKFYHLSLNLGFRNIFRITEELIRKGSEVYFEHEFQGNTNKDSKDNYVERKVKSLFEKLLPTANFYHSLDYEFIDNGKAKKTELDIIGISKESAYIIEVKAGILNDKHRRGALKGLKDRLEQTVTAGSYQCQRAINYINSTENPHFTYADSGTRKTLAIDKTKITSFHKITVTFEHLASISANLKYLVEAGIFSEEYKWSWIVSLYDLMVFADLMPNEEKFKEYLDNRTKLYDRDDIEFSDELDVLGFFMEGNFPLGSQKDGDHLQMLKYSDRIEEYYAKKTMGIPGVQKPLFKSKS